MFKSPEFWSPEAYRAKVKTPLEFVVSAVRASGAEVEDARAAGRHAQQHGHDALWHDAADRLLDESRRLGELLGAAGAHEFRAGAGRRKDTGSQSRCRQPGSGKQPQQRPTDAQQALATLENSLLSGDISKQTHDTISKQLEDPKISQRRLDDPKRPPNVAAITGLILGSPEFQRR